jgi:metal-responsive CopG/Arc/MetJ family transcriptional regulator
MTKGGKTNMPKRINIYLPEDIDKKLEEYLGKEDLKKSATIRKALTAYFEDAKGGDEDTERLSSLEGEIQDISKTQKAILKNLGLKVKKEEETEPEEETVELVDEEEEEVEEEDW